MKNLVCLLTIFSLVFSFSFNAYAQENSKMEDRYFTENYTFDYDQISIPLNIARSNSTTAEELSERYDIELETAKTVLNYLNTASSEKQSQMQIESIKVIKPKESNERYSTKRTYKGYGNKEYYEETVEVNAKSNPAVIASSQKTSFIDKTLKVVVEFGVDTAINSVTAGSWSLFKALGNELVNQGVSSTASVDYLAAIYEDKYTKHTYVLEGNQKYFGAKTEASDAEFENYVQTPGTAGKLIKGKREACKTIYTDYYSKPDRKAYNTYLSSGYIESINAYKYNGKKFYSY